MSRRTQLISNSFAITRLPTKDYYMYDGALKILISDINDNHLPAIPQRDSPQSYLTAQPVVFQPEIENRERGKRNQLFHHLQVTVAPQLFNPRLVYDGKAIAYSPGLLNMGGNSGMTFNISLGSKTQPPVGSRGSYLVRLNLTSSPRISPNDVNDLIKRGKSSTAAATATNLVQLIVRQGPNMNHTNNGRAYFTGKDAQAINGSGLELWRGIFQSVRPTLGKMVLTIDTSTAVVYKAGPLIGIAMEFLEIRQGVRGLRLLERDPNFLKLEKFLKRLRIKVKTGANGSRSRIKTIRGLVPAAGEVVFEKEGEGQTTVEQHFRKAYGLSISYPSIIGVRLTGKNSSHQDVVPAELCDIESGQLFRQKIPEKFTSDMVRFSTMKPHIRLQKIMEGAVAYNRSEYIIESGMALDSQALKVDAKILTTPSVEYGQGYSMQVAQGAWNVVGKKFHAPKFLQSWAIVNFCPDRINPEQCDGMVQAIKDSCTKLGMGLNRPHNIYLGSGQTVQRDLDNAMADIARKVNNDVGAIASTVLFILLPQSAAAIRTAVKHWGDIGRGIKTQCLREGKVVKANDQYWNNVSLKLNARLGGRNSRGISPAMLEFEKQPFIIMGADVGHPGPGIQKPSVTSLVYSHDEFATQYAALSGIQTPRTEIIENLHDFVYEAVLNWAVKNRVSPRNIVMFRDGVSEGEYESVAEQEIHAMKAAFKKLWADKNVKDPLPQLTFIIVGKRHHAVFFPLPQQGDRTGNCHPGSVIDRDVTHPGYPNFYLQSHAAIQGTCRSSHYIILQDEIFNSRNDLSKIQSIAFTLCHVYAKATRSVSIPAPVYYADLVCSRGGFHMSPDVNLNFDEGVSVTSGQTTFDLSAWQGAFKQTNKLTELDKSMYFL